MVEDVAAQIKSWEERKQKHLKTLVALIRKIINLVKDSGGNAVLKYSVESDKLLLLCKIGNKEMLPKDLYSKWDDAHNLEAQTDTQNDAIQEPKMVQELGKSISTVSNIRKQSRPWPNVETL